MGEFEVSIGKFIKRGRSMFGEIGGGGGKSEMLLTATSVPPHLTRGHSHIVPARDNKGRRPTRR
jgi:hypothetical protein